MQSGRYNDTACEFIVKNKNGFLGLLNSQGQTLIPEAYKKLYSVETNYYNKTEKYFYGKNEQNKFGIVSQKNNIFLPFIYDSILSFYNLYDKNNNFTFINSVYSVKKDGKYGIANRNGFLFEPLANEPMKLINSNLNDSVFYAISIVNGKDENLYCSKNGLLISAEKRYNFSNNDNNYINDFKNGILKFIDNKNGFYGILFNNKILEIVPAKYNHIGVFDFYGVENAPKNRAVKYYALNFFPGTTTADIITNTGIKFFEDTQIK